jgi:uncharacterized protein Yka (UPF0111/DUF47 family)
MSGKTRIIEELGQASLLLPQYLERALSANDRVKYYFTLLQTAKAQADRPRGEALDLRAERLASGVGEERFDEVVAASRRSDDGTYHIPEAARLHRLVAEGIGDMLAPLEAADGAEGFEGAANESYRRRLEELLAAAPQLTGDRLPGAYVGAMTRAQRGDGDSLHLLVMDLHKELNRLQALLARESIAGARVYGLDDDDRPLVRAFMTGLNRTAPLKFDHPGLGTTATRSGAKLVIQNDIGTTDAHVLVVHVEGLETVVTYTDVHLQRADFFRSLFEGRGVEWEDTRSRRDEQFEDGAYHLCLGRHRAADRAEQEEHLAFLGSRLVFLIDWNRARKRLRPFVKKRDAIAVLRWAADHDHGHRAFLELGGERLIFEAVEHASPTPVRYGERLDQILGREGALAFLQFVLRNSAEGLLAGRSERLLRDEVKAELLSHFDSAQQGLLASVADQAVLITELAGGVRDGLLRLAAPGAGERLERLARRARRWERQADELVMGARSPAHRRGESVFYARLIGDADDVADGLEEAAFLLPLLPAVAPGQRLLEPLEALAGLLVEGSQEYVKCVEVVGHVHRGGAREDVQDFLAAVDRMVTIEHQTDDAEREVTRALVEEGGEARQLFLLAEIARTLEGAADALTRCALTLRDHVLSEVMTG